MNKANTWLAIPKHCKQLTTRALFVVAAKGGLEVLLRS